MSKQPRAERRRNRRTDRLKHLRVSWEGNTLGVCRISDLSADGVFVKVATPLDPGTPIKLILEAPGKEIRTHAVVRHALSGKGMGVEFVDMDDYDRERLRSLVESVEAQEPAKVQPVGEPDSDVRAAMHGAATPSPPLKPTEPENQHMPSAMAPPDLDISQDIPTVDKAYSAIALEPAIVAGQSASSGNSEALAQGPSVLVESEHIEESTAVRLAAEADPVHRIEADMATAQSAASEETPIPKPQGGGEKLIPGFRKGAERRTDRRRRFSARAEIIQSELGEIIEARIRDLSRGGCYVDTKKPFALGTVVLVRVSRKEGSFEAQARVVYSAANKGVGLFFEAIAPDQIKLLDRWLGESDWVASAGRRRQRLNMRIKVRVSGADSSGGHFDEETHTRTVSVLGGLIPLSAPIDEGQRLVLVNSGTRAEMECRVAYVGKSEGDCNPIGVTFLLPNPRFWNVNFPPESETAEHNEPADVDHDDALRRVARSIAEDTPKSAQRRPRFEAKIPVRLFWEEGEEHLAAEGTTINVSTGGALLSVARCAAIGQKIVLINSNSGEQIECQVRYLRQSESGPVQARVEFIAESAEFWGAGILGLAESKPAEADQKPSAPQHSTSRKARPAPKVSAQAESARVPGTSRSEPAPKVPGFLAKNWRVLAGAGLGLICALAWFAWSSSTPQGTGAAAPISQPAASLAGIPPEEASLIPGSAGYGLAKEADFDPSAVAWLHSRGLQGSGDIPGQYSGAGDSHAYILKGAAGDWRVVIVADGRVRCDAHYKSLGIAARVPKAVLSATLWKNGEKFDSEGDGLLVVRSAQDQSSGVVLLLAGDQVTSGTPSDYHQVPLQ